MRVFSSEIVKRVGSVWSQDAVSLHPPHLDDEDVKEVSKCIRSSFVSTFSGYVDDFERSLGAYVGSSYVVATNSGTSGLHLALKAIGVGAESEVLVPNISFVATANAVSYCGATPHFVDVEPDFLGVDPLKLRIYLGKIGIRIKGSLVNKNTGRQIKALIVMHCFGRPCMMEEILDVCNLFNILLVEDAAEALGSRYRDAHIGNVGVCSVLSFNGNKIITTGGGGAVLTKDEGVAQRIRCLANVAKSPGALNMSHSEVGYNYRMPGLNAALGISQLNKISSILERKRRLFNSYMEAFSGLSEVSLMGEPDKSVSNFWLQVIRIDDRKIDCASILNALNGNGFQCRGLWTPLCLLPPYASNPRADDLSSSLEAAHKIICLPSNV